MSKKTKNQNENIIKNLEDELIKNAESPDISHKRRILILGYKRLSGAFFIRLGKYLYESEQKKDYETLGFESWKALIVAPEESGGYGMDYVTADKLKKIYSHYVIKGISTLKSLEQIAEPFKLYEARKFINSKEDWELINQPLSEIRKLKSNIDEAHCEHKNIKECWKCLDCGSIFYNNPINK